MSKAKIRWVKEHKYLINVSWSKKMVCAAVSQNPMLHRNFPTFECHWLSGRTAILGLLIVVLRHGHVGGCNPDHLIEKLCNIEICRRGLNPKQDQGCVRTWLSLGPWMASVKTVLDCTWSFLAQGVGETYCPGQWISPNTCLTFDYTNAVSL